MKNIPFQNPVVAAVFAGYPERFETKLLFLRYLIFDMAAKIKRLGRLEEILKWGEPSYLTIESKTGSTVRYSVSACKRVYGYAVGPDRYITGAGVL